MVINHMHPTWPGWDATWERRFNDLYGYDPEAAKRLLAEAGRLYAQRLSGIAMLPAGCRPSIHAARLLYAEIGRAVERNGHDSVTRRAVVPTPRKLALLAVMALILGFVATKCGPVTSADQARANKAQIAH